MFVWSARRLNFPQNICRQRITCPTLAPQQVMCPDTNVANNLLSPRLCLQCPFNEPETGNVPGPGAYGGLQDNSSFNKVAPKTLTDEKIGFNSTGRRTSPGPSRHTENMPGPGEYDLGMQSIVGGLKYKRRIGCKGVFG